MPFDPNLPQENTLIDAAQMRAQLNGLKELIDNIPAGPQGEQGPPGDQGPAGNPGEVTNAALNDAIAGTARNPTDLSTLDTPFADPDSESLRLAYNALLNKLFRAPT